MGLADYQENEAIDCFALVKSAEQRQTKAGKDYLAFVLADQTGDLPGNLWDVTPEQIQSLQPGRVVHVTGTRDSYRGNPQMKLTSIRLAQEDEPHDPGDFVQRAPMAEGEMTTVLNELLLQVQQPDWQRLLRYLFKKYRNEFLQYPAAKMNHHAFVGGLAYHSLSIARLATQILPLYPQLNADLLLTGALLHDLGKVIELSGPVATDYTVTGKLIGHITLIDEQLVLAANDLALDLNSEELVLLRHVVLAHHGLQEYGSPIRPQVMEAEVLHQLDELDAGLQSMTSALEQTEAGAFSKKIFALDNRAFYRPTSSETN
ncbi:HD domain-containing protein [Leuconostocaceae bacterium ESL0958]|nr:HD domain-containing protein [Leuconostocaceae bacterium ESL0958]